MGVPENSGVWGADVVADYGSTTLFLLGRSNTYGRYLDGQIDEVAIWSRVLTADERAELYALGRGRYYDFS